ncbi:hypothetical protein TRAPUB_3885 [Trametes pubescens]|uniref:Uncharacterized protein n=1 Tax=Trametes pubescens TaxID=154538 RepID=A0A1M2VCL1_TRAPU|nr:hypothetical protein TRAPUB_3885 [Trametes pubescens]
MAAPTRPMVYMNVPATRGDKDESFEERRFLDYLKAYQATGKPPVPSPPVPTDPQQRAALGLPPLFEPLIEAEAVVNGIITPSTSSATPITPSPSSAPPNFLAQAFVPTRVEEYGSETFFHSIVSQAEYSKWSFEELRAEAYKAGKKYADTPVLPPQRRE